MNSRPELTVNSTYQEIFQRLSKLNTPSICDANREVRLMDTKIKPIGSYTQCVGRAYTVSSNQDSLSTMQALDDLQAFLAFLDPSEKDIVPIILVISACGSPYALAGGMCASVAKAKGFGGVVIDGPCRDLEEIKATHLPFFAKGKCAKSGTKDKVGTRKQQIECGGVGVKPGDIIFADSDGIVAMSKEEVVSIIPKGEEIQMKENLALQKILDGARFNEICNIDEHVNNIQSGITPTKLRLTI